MIYFVTFFLRTEKCNCLSMQSMVFSPSADGCSEAAPAVLVHGPSGAGKTLITTCVARRLGMHLIKVKTSSICPWDNFVFSTFKVVQRFAFDITSFGYLSHSCLELLIIRLLALRQY